MVLPNLLGYAVVPSPPWEACRHFASHEVSYVRQVTALKLSHPPERMLFSPLDAVGNESADPHCIKLNMPKMLQEHWPMPQREVVWHPNTTATKVEK